MQKILFLATVVACAAPAPAVTLATPTATSPAPSASPLELPHEPERVIFRGALPAWGAATLGNGIPWTRALPWLQGIDAAHGRAWVSVEALDGSDAFEIDTIDLARGSETRWIATNHDARMRAFHPLTGRPAEDLARYASMVDATGPFVVRARDYAGPHVAVSRDLIAYESDPDVLMLARRDGSHAARLDVGTKAAYHPIFSPDGSRVAFTACTERTIVPPGAFHRCPYRVYVARIGSAPASYAVLDPQPPTFSADGRYVYAASRDDDYADEPIDRGGVAERIDVTTGDVRVLAWAKDLHDVSLETGATRAVLHGWRGTPGEQTREFRWLELPSGKALGRVSVERGTSNVSYGGGNWLFASAQQGLVAVDLARGLQVALPSPRQTTTWISNQWKDAHTVYALRTLYTERAYEIVELDARAILDQR